jgi:hypothetical protein
VIERADAYKVFGVMLSGKVCVFIHPYGGLQFGLVLLGQTLK